MRYNQFINGIHATNQQFDDRTADQVPSTPGSSAPASRCRTASRPDLNPIMISGSRRCAEHEVVGNADGRSTSSSTRFFRRAADQRRCRARLRAVDEYLKATQLIVERQVMLEAKIIEVSLNDSDQDQLVAVRRRRRPASRSASWPGNHPVR